jgi:hypothetical protein
MVAACAGKWQSAKIRIAGSAERIFIARKLPARGEGFKANGGGVVSFCSEFRVYAALGPPKRRNSKLQNTTLSKVAEPR